MNTSRIVASVGVVAALVLLFYLASPKRDPAATPGPAAQPAPAATGGGIGFAVFPTVADRFVGEPCSRVPGGGLMSLQAAFEDIVGAAPGAIGVCFGDMTLAEGGIGRRVANYHYAEVFKQTGVANVAAGEGELGLGVDFVRDVLTRIEGVQFICANAVDGKGLPVMRRWALAKCGKRWALIVAVAGESIQAEITRRGSEVKISPPQKAVEDARKEALAQASLAGLDVAVFALFVHGTVDEAAALVEKTSGVTFAAAAHGPVLAASEPRMVGGVPIVYGGQGLRFAWAVFLPDDRPIEPNILRIGGRLLARPTIAADSLRYFRESRTSNMYEEVDQTPGDRRQDPRGAYVGASRCGDCHIETAAQFAASAHAKPSKILLASPFVGSTSCAGCHQTGTYATGGWPGPRDKTSDLAAVSCEACHGPGEMHAAQPKTTRMPTVGFNRCYECHLPDRSVDFDATAAWKRWGHKSGVR